MVSGEIATYCVLSGTQTKVSGSFLLPISMDGILMANIPVYMPIYYPKFHQTYHLHCEPVLAGFCCVLLTAAC